MKKIFLGLCLLLFLTPIYAKVGSLEANLPSGSVINMSEVFGVLLSLGAVLFLILLFSFSYKKLTNFSINGQVKMQVVSSVPVGTKEKVSLIRVGDESFLIGVSQGNVNLLSKMTIDYQKLEQTQGSHFFSENLQQALNKEL